jgi:hypothetical protein
MQRIRIAFLLQLFSLQALSSWSQTDPVEELKSRFEDYNKQQIPEKLFAHTDKSIYLAGEILWFKLYDVDGYFHLPLGISRIAYVELLDHNNRPLVQVKISLDSGKGNGSIYLANGLNSGNYVFRAYTSWMKNFNAGYFFEKQISIINSQKIQEANPSQRPLTYDIGFFPEGGNLVNSLQAKVAFRITDRYGRGVQSDGWICGDQGDTLLSFHALKFGMGNFDFTPVAHHLYKAIVRLPAGQVLIKELPMAYDSGYTMSLVEQGREGIRVDVHLSAVAPGRGNPTVYLFIHTRGLVKWAARRRMQDGLASFSIEKSSLGEGISQLTLFDQERRPACERLYFKYPEHKLGLAVDTDQQAYGRRKKIQLSISSANQDGKPLSADCSIAVYRLDSLQVQDETEIGSYLWLSSDLQGPVESPAFYFKEGGPESATAMDNLMLTQGWRRFRWEEVLQGKKAAFEFLPELDGHIVCGRITNLRTGKEGKNIDGFLSVPGTRTQLRTARSDEEGKIRFLMRDFFGSEEIIVQAGAGKDSVDRFDIENPFSDQNPRIPLPEFSMPEIAPAILLYKSINMQVQNLYIGDKLQEVERPLADSIAFYGQPDERYLLDNYTRFTTMEEVLREYVNAVNVVKKAGKFHLPLSNLVTKLPYENDPLVLLDGVPVFDMGQILGYDPLKIRKLELVARKYFLGYSSFDGIMNFSSYTGDLPGFDLDPHAIVLNYEGLQLHRKFYSPQYDTELQLNSHLPDFRDLLYWSPDLRTNEQGKGEISFYSSDIPGKYVIVLQGLTDSGIPGSKSAFFEIK